MFLINHCDWPYFRGIYGESREKKPIPLLIDIIVIKSAISLKKSIYWLKIHLIDK